MAECSGYNGTATLARTPEGPVWLHADPGIHVAAELLAEPLLLAAYEIVGRCEITAAETYHARRLCEEEDVA